MAYDHHRPEISAQAFEARREIRDLDRRAVGVMDRRDQDRRIAEVVLFAVMEAVDGDIEKSVIAVIVEAGTRFVMIFQQAAEYGIAVKMRQAAPDDPPVLVDQRAEPAISDDAEIQISHFWRCRFPCCSLKSAIHALTL